MGKFADIIKKFEKQKTINLTASFTDGVLRKLPDRYLGILLALDVQKMELRPV